MSVVIVAPGKMITVPLLFQQMWITPIYEKLIIEDIFDIVIENNSSTTLDCVCVLYAHDIYDASSKAIVAEVLPFGPWSERDWDWYLASAPRFTDESEREMLFEAEPGVEIKCVSCGAQLEVWGDLKPDVAALMSVVRTTIIEVRLNPAIEAGCTGALRLRFKPLPDKLGIDTSPVAIPAAVGDVDHRFVWDMCIDSPSVIRNTTRARFRSALQQPNNPDRLRLDELRETFVKAVNRQLGTTTRIPDHRIAVIAPSNTEVVPLNVSDSFFLAYTMPLGPTKARLKKSYVATVWAAGSNRNVQCVVWQNVCRISDHLSFIYRSESRDALIEKCGHSARPEACAVLLDAMKEAGILRNSQLNVLELGVDMSSKEFKEGVVNVCQQYEDVCSDRLPELKSKLGLYREFKNLHPFKILFRVRWESFPEGYKDKAAVAMEALEHFKVETRGEWRKAWKWTLIALVIGIAGFVVTAIALTLQLLGP